MYSVEVPRNRQRIKVHLETIRHLVSSNNSSLKKVYSETLLRHQILLLDKVLPLQLVEVYLGEVKLEVRPFLEVKLLPPPYSDNPIPRLASQQHLECNNKVLAVVVEHHCFHKIKAAPVECSDKTKIPLMFLDNNHNSNSNQIKLLPQMLVLDRPHNNQVAYLVDNLNQRQLPIHLDKTLLL